ncbi:MAG: hypothetical protein FJ290_30050 [Planctomycetes bacterium]|nr:hypothetical protein [Planctomycetota bacterium]
MMRPLDTTEEADRIQFEIFGRMSAAEKVRRMSDLTELVRATFEAGIRKRHPQYTGRDARLARIRWELGDELYRNAYPSEALLDP